jgi:hypothetical protein
MWMDTTQARGHAGKIDSGVSSVKKLIAEISNMLENTYWSGADRERFMADWDGQLRPAAAQVVQNLQSAADELRRRADEQDALSQRGQ